MSKNKIISYVSILIIVLAVFTTTALKVYKMHNERLLEVTTKAIIDSAKKCYYNNSCVNNRITLNELYDKMGLSTQTNPITKKVYNDQSYVDVKNNFQFNEIN